MDLPPPPLRGETSKPVRYNPVPIGGPDRPPVNHSPSPGTIYASSPGRKENFPGRRASSVKTGPNSPNFKREPGQRGDSAHPREPPSLVTDQSERSSTGHLEAGDDETKSEDADGESRKKRQKRNKPTLSCFECVERKTKVGLSLLFCFLVEASARGCVTGPRRVECFQLCHCLASWNEDDVFLNHGPELALLRCFFVRSSVMVVALDWDWDWGGAPEPTIRCMPWLCSGRSLLSCIT